MILCHADKLDEEGMVAALKGSEEYRINHPKCIGNKNWNKAVLLRNIHIFLFISWI